MSGGGVVDGHAVLTQRNGQPVELIAANGVKANHQARHQGALVKVVGTVVEAVAQKSKCLALALRDLYRFVGLTANVESDIDLDHLDTFASAGG
jgi:hypothetical protein